MDGDLMNLNLMNFALEMKNFALINTDDFSAAP